MTSFIVISTENRLHHIVDSIEKCCPLNNDIDVKLSIGKIINNDGDLTYKYSILGGDSSNNEKKDFSTLFANQLAHFRLYCHIANNDMINVFLLENPLVEDDFEKCKLWQEEIQKVYDEGYDKSFRLFRVIFSYNVQRPGDVVTQIPIEYLKSILTCHIGVESSFESFIFYIDNQKCDAAALCSDKDDHNLKIPRMLCDFMMLASNSMDSYGVLQGIHNTVSMNRAFSVGYAESMYYFDDVERFFIMADTCVLHRRMLQDEDETTFAMRDKERMNVESHPFGLQKRLQSMKPKYADVPFTEDINDFTESADKIIDDCIVSLHDDIEAEREQEIQDFLKPYNDKRNVLLTELDLLLNLPQNERDEAYANQVRLKENEIKNIDKIIEEQRKQFKYECPEYISRNEIYTQAIAIDEDEKRNDFIIAAKTHYRKLIDFVRGEKFAIFLKNKKIGENPVPPSIEDDKTEIKSEGCLSRIMFWRKKTQKPVIQPPRDPASIATNKKLPTYDEVSKLITKISNQLLLKKQYTEFHRDVDLLESDLKEESLQIKNFRLTDHTSHYYHLINLEALRRFHNEESKNRLDIMIDGWRNEEKPERQTRTSIENYIKNESKKYASKFRFIDWTSPFQFVNMPSTNNLPSIINELNKMSAPCAHYYQVTSLAQNIITKKIYSDLPQFVDFYDQVKSNVSSADYIIAIESKHIASKICFMQFLPMDEELVKNLTDLNCPEEVIPSIDQEYPVTQKNTKETRTEEPIIDWGEKQ